MLAKAKDIDAWIDAKLPKVELKGDHRHRIPAQLFDLAIEHHAGISHLLTARLYASGFALVRCQFECYVRGAWLHYCATDEEIETFIAHDRVPKMSPMIEALEQKETFKDGSLSRWKEDGWDAMNGYTHGGIHQISRRMEGKYIEPSFGNDALLEVARFSSGLALLSFGRIAALADRQDLWDEAGAKMAAV